MKIETSRAVIYVSECQSRGTKSATASKTFTLHPRICLRLEPLARMTRGGKMSSFKNRRGARTIGSTRYNRYPIPVPYSIQSDRLRG